MSLYTMAADDHQEKFELFCETWHMAGYTRIRLYHSSIDTQRVSCGSFLAHEPTPALPLSWGSVLVNMMALDDAFEDRKLHCLDWVQQ